MRIHSDPIRTKESMSEKCIPAKSLRYHRAEQIRKRVCLRRKSRDGDAIEIGESGCAESDRSAVVTAQIGFDTEPTIRVHLCRRIPSIETVVNLECPRWTSPRPENTVAERIKT